MKSCVLVASGDAATAQQPPAALGKVLVTSEPALEAWHLRLHGRDLFDELFVRARRESRGLKSVRSNQHGVREHLPLPVSGGRTGGVCSANQPAPTDKMFAVYPVRSPCEPRSPPQQHALKPHSPTRIFALHTCGSLWPTNKQPLWMHHNVTTHNTPTPKKGV